MTELVDRAGDHCSPTRDSAPRTPVELASRQLHAIEAFNAARRTAEQAAAAAGRSREMRMDADRTLEVIRREHQAIIARTEVQLRESAALLRATSGRRVVLAHRNAWFVGKVSELLRDNGFAIVAAVDNGADAVGTAVAEQPDLLLVEDRLAMVPGEHVVREVRRYCSDALIAAQVDYGDRVGALLEAGASAVFTRQIPPADVARRLRGLFAA